MTEGETYSLAWKMWLMVSALLGALLGATRPGFMGPGETWVIALLGAVFGLILLGLVPHFAWLVWADRPTSTGRSASPDRTG